jgi:hypothetical protein
MIALEKMSRVDTQKPSFIPSANWNWKPEVTDPEAIDKTFIEASGGNTTSRSTGSSQTDHGENY